MNKNRFLEIDFLRGLAMLAMIIIHTSVFFLSDAKIILYLWDYSQFAVPLFVFCSAYLFFTKQEKKSLDHFLFYLKKRVIRLLKPYYIFMIFFFVAVFIRQPKIFTVSYIFKSIFLVGGVDINWLVLLFLYFMFLMPFLSFTFKSNKIIFWLYTFFAILSSVIFSFWKYPYDYRYMLWLPWSVIIIFTFFFVRLQNKKLFYFGSIFLSAGVFLLLRYFESLQKLSLHFYDNKYPPNMYFLSFGIAAIVIIYLLAKLKIFLFFPIKQLFLFLSTYSYSLFFIHYFYLYILTGISFIHFSFLTLFLSVFCLAMFTQLLWNIVQKAIAK